MPLYSGRSHDLICYVAAPENFRRSVLQDERGPKTAFPSFFRSNLWAVCAATREQTSSFKSGPRTIRLEKDGRRQATMPSKVARTIFRSIIVPGSFYVYTPQRPCISACRTRYFALRDRNGPRCDHPENIAPVSRRHHREGRLP